MRSKLMAAGAVIAAARFAIAGTATLNTLAQFTGPNGQAPAGNLAVDQAGNIYGTTSGYGKYADGNVFEVSGPSHQTLSTVFDFMPGGTGTYPHGGVIFDSAGNLYGTTQNYGPNAYGTVYELSGSAHQTFTLLAAFTNTTGALGGQPLAGLTIDSAGNLYGTTYYGGTGNAGTVFELSGPNHQTLTTLLSFSKTNGANPQGGLLIDGAGNLFGTTVGGGAGGSGTVFELSGPTHQSFSTLASFNGPNGAGPACTLTQDSSGNLYGTTTTGGAANDGTVFELSGPGYQSLTTLATFNGSNGADPIAGVIVDAVGNLFGTDFGAYGSIPGTAFELSGPGLGTFTTLATFTGPNGADPVGGLAADTVGNLYGTTANGGSNNDGVVFQLSNTGFAVPEPAGLVLPAAAAVVGWCSKGRRRR